MIKTAAALLGVYALSTLAARAWFRRLLFRAPRQQRGQDGACPDDARLHTLRARDGARVHAMEVSAPAARGTVVYFHGNAETAADVVPLARMLADQGLRIFVLEYRGYGMSRDAGLATEATLYADAEALVEQLVGERRAAPGLLALWGSSLGCAVAIEMARRFPVDALVLVSPFTSTRAVCRHHAPFFPSAFVVRDAFDSLDKARGLTMPTLVLHGEADRLVPATMGRALAARVPEGRYVGVEGAGHGVLATHGDDVVREALAHLTTVEGAASRR